MLSPASWTGLLKVNLWGWGGVLNKCLLMKKRHPSSHLGALSLEKRAVNSGLKSRATNCHFVQYFILLCTYQSIKQVVFLVWMAIPFLMLHRVSKQTLARSDDAWEKYTANTVLRLNSKKLHWCMNDTWTGFIFYQWLMLLFLFIYLSI